MEGLLLIVILLMIASKDKALAKAIDYFMQKRKKKSENFYTKTTGYRTP